MNVSAVVITYNDEKHLEDCLNNLRVCNQLIVVDLGSSDDSVSIGKKYATHFLSHKWEPIAEFVFPEILDLLNYEWVLRADPDEVYPLSLLKTMAIRIDQDDNVSRYLLPFQYYFMNSPLEKTAWGGIRYFDNKLININRVNLTKRVHGSIETKKPFVVKKINSTQNNVVIHYWVDSYKELFEKHKRYLKLEGKTRFERGQKFSIKSWVIQPLENLYNDLITEKGIFGSLDEIFLCFFHAWYISKCLLALKDYSRNYNLLNKSV